MFGALTGLVPLSVDASREGAGLPVPAVLLPLKSVTGARFVVAAVVVPATPPVFASTVPPRDTPSLGDCWSKTSSS